MKSSGRRFPKAIFPRPKRCWSVWGGFFLFIFVSPRLNVSAAASTDTLKDLPLVLSPVKADSLAPLAVVLSGDGGWAAIDRSLTTRLNERGIPVVGLNSLKYFWHRRTPDEAAKDLTRILETYTTAWNRTSIILIGYSRGADVLPFLIRRLPEDVKKKVELAALLGLEPDVEFEIHVSAFWNGGKPSRVLPVRPELEDLKGLKVLCVFGADEKDSLCPELPRDLSEPVMLKGGHHFGGDYSSVVKEIIDRLTVSSPH